MTDVNLLLGFMDPDQFGIPVFRTKSEKRLKDLISDIRKEGGTVQAYDPEGMIQARQNLGDEGITYCENAYDAIRGADIMVVVTEWNEFRLLDLERVHGLLKDPNIVDLRNVYEPAAVRELGFKYECVGRKI